MLDIKKPGVVKASDMMTLSEFIRDIVKLNPNNYRIFGPDEALSNRNINITIIITCKSKPS